MKHIPVLLNAVLDTLGDLDGARVIDATFGAGGYTRAFLSRGAIVTAFDRDPNVMIDVNAIKSEYGDRFSFIARPFSDMANLDQTYDAIVFDLGISSMQIDVAARGFSFRADADLDMRMSGTGETAAELIARCSVDELSRILRDYGDVTRSGALASAIKRAAPRTTLELKSLIYNPKDVAPVFQALRIAVNDELGEVERALDAVPRLLNVGGKCVCVTFHSLEDRLVKNTFRDWTNVRGDPRMPVISAAPFELLRTQKPTKTEVDNNPRARSAHMRAVIKSY